jgi:hypothetical protein
MRRQSAISPTCRRPGNASTFVRVLSWGHLVVGSHAAAGAKQVPGNNANDVQDVSDFMPFDSAARELERKVFKERKGERGL